MRKLQWDIFCKVVDNFGDIGVCWRLAADLATRQQRVRLWVDDASALSWMAPNGCNGVQVLAWTPCVDIHLLAGAPCDVLIEAFGCDAAPEFIAACVNIHYAPGKKDPAKPLWINLEYLSAERYVAKTHGLTQLVSSGAAAGWRKVFYYPGFTPDTGGLLREPGLTRRQAGFDRAAWLKQFGVDVDSEKSEKLVSLFCYEPPLLAAWLDELAQNGIDGRPARLLVTDGRAARAVEAINPLKKASDASQIGLEPNEYKGTKLSISYLPALTQTDFDHLLWASDINFVRGEDSLVRAIWAGKPFVWHIYPQDDGAHGPKLEAFLDMLDAPPSLQAFHRAWNRLAMPSPIPLLALTDLVEWQRASENVRLRLAGQLDLTTGLIEFAQKSR